MADFPADPKPDYPIDEGPSEPEVLVSTHKDGSEQRRYKGAGRRRTFRLKFGGSMPITNAQRLSIANHWTGQGGTAVAFSWTHPERADVYLVRYSERPSFRLVAYDCYEAEVSFQEVPA